MHVTGHSRMGKEDKWVGSIRGGHVAACLPPPPSSNQSGVIRGLVKSEDLSGMETTPDMLAV